MAVDNAQSTARLLSAANTNNATSVSNGFTKVYGIGGFNAGTVSYLKLYDKGSAPVAADTPRRTIYLPANVAFQLDFVNPLTFSKGLGYRIVTGVADADDTAVAAAAVLALNIDYT